MLQSDYTIFCIFVNILLRGEPMNPKIRSLIDEKGENHILPFFWQHGEDEATLRKYMAVIHQAGIGAVCVESRPHPDFCGPKWWRDMYVILDEARTRGMKVWILDDSHFPTGYANGALKDAPEELCRQFVLHKSVSLRGGKSIRLDIARFLKRTRESQTMLGFFMSLGQKQRVYSGDTLLAVTALRLDRPCQIDLTGRVKDDKLDWRAPEGEWKLCLHKLSRNSGMHRSYINMLDAASCRVLIDAVYEPHYAHYAADFGKTIAGFFSDEPELGNGPFLKFGNTLGTDQPLPWSQELAVRLEQALGPEWVGKLGYLWQNDLDADETARVRYIYMDALTRLVEKDFSFQIGDWCRARGVEYIGHVIEDNNQHARTGSALGHYFRGLAGQDMAGIDDVGGQVYPQGEVEPKKWMRFIPRDGEFYHYALGKLASSHAAIDPLKKGRAMCEIFGNYGWSEGLRLEKYLADHFMVRGVNYYVPHAFSPRPFPDPDCPPHFYADGHDAQYRHFGHLMRYMNRVCELISGGQAVTPVAILYHGEAEWTGKCMLMQAPAHLLADRQIDYDFLPSDVFTETERFNTDLSNGLSINGKHYRALVIPTAEYISADLAKAAGQLQRIGYPVLVLEALPKGVYDGENMLLGEIQNCRVVRLDQLVSTLDQAGVPDISIAPASDRLRYLHYQNGSHLYYFVNEAASAYRGTITIPVTGTVYAYNAWENRLETIQCASSESMTEISVELERYKSLIVVFDEADRSLLAAPLAVTGAQITLPPVWRRSTCRSIDYPKFSMPKEIRLPDHLTQEQPKFSGFVRYENELSLEQVPNQMALEITDAWEGVEVFVNGASAGIQIVPTYLFDITPYLLVGKNQIVIEVATTLERERAAGKRGVQEKALEQKIKSPIGLTGIVRLYAHQ